MKRFLLVGMIILIPALIGCTGLSPEYKSSVQKADIAMQQLAPKWKQACHEKAAALKKQSQSDRRNRDMLISEAIEWKHYGDAAAEMAKWSEKLVEHAKVGD